MVEVNGLRIKEPSFKSFKADATDLSYPENIRGRQIMGLPGLNLFTDFELEIDRAQGVISLIRCDKKGEPARTSTGACGRKGKLEFDGSGLFTKVYAAEKPPVVHRHRCRNQHPRNFCHKKVP